MTREGRGINAPPRHFGIDGQQISEGKDEQMGREVRMVPPTWVHPKRDDSYPRNVAFKPMYPGDRYAVHVAEWDEGESKWNEGFIKDWSRDSVTGWKPRPEGYENRGYSAWDGLRPDRDDYMPVWTPEEATHYMMYEDTTEGTPKSPAFATPEELARWLVDNKVSAFADLTNTYDEWLSICKGGFAGKAFGVTHDGALMVAI